MRKVKKDIFKNYTKRISNAVLTGEMHYKTTYKDINKFLIFLTKRFLKISLFHLMILKSEK